MNLDFIPKEVDTRPIIPALARVFDAALAGGGAKSINFQELASDLAEITFKFPFRIPPLLRFGHPRHKRIEAYRLGWKPRVCHRR